MPNGQPAQIKQPGLGDPDAPGIADSPANELAGQHARKLEQIKDLYLTAEAIGEENVDKHFDQLLAQQRDLISDYFKQSKAALKNVPDPAEQTAGQAEQEGDSGPHPVNA